MRRRLGDASAVGTVIRDLDEDQAVDGKGCNDCVIVNGVDHESPSGAVVQSGPAYDLGGAPLDRAV